MTVPCLGADPHPKPPRFEVPPGAADCHAHVIADPLAQPFVPERSFTPPPAPVAALRAMHRVLGLERVVIVTPSVYGTDNRVTLAAIAAYGTGARGVAVVDPSITEVELRRLHEGGIRGLRLNVLFGGGVGLRALRPLAERIAPLGWHVQLLVDASRHLVDLAPTIRALGVPVVVDHMGNMPVAVGLDDPGFRALLELVRDGHCWAKLSGANRVSTAQPHYRDAIPFARALLEAGPKRMVWGTDWPHVALQEHVPNDGDLLDMLDDYAPDAATRQAILVDNPALLYGFASLVGDGDGRG